jgi:hypothetical protein
MISCATIQPAPVEVSATSPEADVVGISIVVTPKIKRIIPKGSRIVIANITGDCSTEVKDALMRRLIDNSDYDVLTRENLDQILWESDINWGGRFNTETAAKLGKLMGASLFIVGRVAYCGYSASDSPDSKFGEFNVFAALQIIDLETGKVLVSSANEGTYIPRPAPLLPAGGPVDSSRIASSTTDSTGSAASVSSEASDQPEKGSPFRILKNPFKGASGSQPSSPKRLKDEKTAPEPEPDTYVRIKAAEDMANGFADKFFARPTWEKVEMWEDPQWKYSDSIRHVRLGHCPTAVRFLEGDASRDLPNMQERDVARYLHNFGVALLCANNPELAMQKLRSAYRVDYNQTTLKMLGLAGKIIEWSLDVEVDQEPVTNMLLERDTYLRELGGSRDGAR